MVAFGRDSEMDILHHQLKKEDQPSLPKEIKPIAVSVKDFGFMFGHDYQWAKSLIDEGRIKSIKGWGELRVPLTEVDVILNSGREESVK